MTTQKIKKMLKELILEIDYDIYKDLFIESECVDKEETEDIINNLIRIVKRHI